jgi:hypothetical protein
MKNKKLESLKIQGKKGEFLNLLDNQSFLEPNCFEIFLNEGDWTNQTLKSLDFNGQTSFI